MRLTASLKDYIDSLTYEELLRRWRRAPIGEPVFQGESGEYWGNRMSELGVLVDTVTPSKKVGWD